MYCIGLPMFCLNGTLINYTFLVSVYLSKAIPLRDKHHFKRILQCFFLVADRIFTKGAGISRAANIFLNS